MSDNNVRAPNNRGELIGCVKWFNNKEGYGFITIMSDGDRNGEDIFAHQSNIYPTTCGYRTLRTGEYISLNLSDEERPQAIDVTGVCGGPLMCDTELRLRNETSGRRSNRTHKRREPNTDQSRDRSGGGGGGGDGGDEDGWKKV
jgi:cold shock CspA family protein